MPWPYASHEPYRPEGQFGPRRPPFLETGLGEQMAEFAKQQAALSNQRWESGPQALFAGYSAWQTMNDPHASDTEKRVALLAALGAFAEFGGTFAGPAGQRTGRLAKQTTAFAKQQMERKRSVPGMTLTEPEERLWGQLNAAGLPNEMIYEAITRQRRTSGATSPVPEVPSAEVLWSGGVPLSSTYHFP